MTKRLIPVLALVATGLLCEPVAHAARTATQGSFAQEKQHHIIALNQVASELRNGRACLATEQARWLRYLMQTLRDLDQWLDDSLVGPGRRESVDAAASSVLSFLAPVCDHGLACNLVTGSNAEFPNSRTLERACAERAPLPLIGVQISMVSALLSRLSPPTADESEQARIALERKQQELEREKRCQEHHPHGDDDHSDDHDRCWHDRAR